MMSPRKFIRQLLNWVSPPRRNPIKKYMPRLKQHLRTKKISSLPPHITHRLAHWRQTLNWKKYKLGYLTALSLATIALSYPTMLYVSTKWKFYALDLVQIIGVENTHPYELLEELNLQKGTSLLAIKTLALEQQLLLHPQIKRVSIRKHYPHTLKITIAEKPIAFLVKTPKDIYAISRNGNVLFSGNRITHHNHFIIELATDVNETNTLNTHPQLQTFLTYFYQLLPPEQNINSLFSNLYLGEDILLFAKNEQLTVRLGAKLSLNKLRQAYYAYLYKQQKNLDKSVIDLRFNFVRFTS